jgi:predicted DNA-binding WGR domain protein
MRRFELIEGKSSKFWEIERDGCDYTVRYGRIGTSGQSLSKSADSEERAQVEVDKLIREKTGKGYVEVGTATASAAATATSSAATATPKTAVASPTSAPIASKVAPVPAADAAAVTAPAIDMPAATAAPAQAARQSDAAVTPPPGPSGEFRWTAAQRKALPAQRGFPPTRQPMNAEEALRWLQALESSPPQQWGWQLQQDEAKALMKECPRSERFSAARLQVADPEGWEELLYLGQLLSDGQHQFLVHGLLELCIALHGLDFTLQRYLGSIERIAGGQRYYYGQAGAAGAEVLAQALADCSDADYQRLRDSLGDPAGLSARQRFALGAIFNTESDRIADAMTVMDTQDYASFEAAAGLAGAALTLLQAEQLARCANMRGHVHAVPTLALNMARLHGAAALSFVARVYDLQTDSAQRERVAAILRAFDSGEAFAELLERIEHKEIRPHIDEFARAWPFTAMQAAAQRIGRSRDKSAEAWLGRMLASHPELLPALNASLEGAALEALQRLQARLVDVEEAPIDALPELLRDPPWLKPQPKLARPALPERALPAPVMRWPDGLQASWRSGMSANESFDPGSNKHKARLGETLERMRVPRSLWPGLMEGSIDDLRPHLPEIEALDAKLAAYSRERSIWQLAKLAPKHRLLLWNALPHFDGYRWENSPWAGSLIAHHELDALPGLLRYITSKPELGLQAALPVAAPEIAPHAAQALSGKRLRVHAAAWLRQHAELATSALLVQATSGAKKPVEQAERALRWLAQQVDRARLQAGARHFDDAGVALLEAILAVDPLSVLPQKPGKLPAFFLPGGYSRPRLKDGRDLPLQTLPLIATQLQVSLLDEPYAGLDILREACCADSLDAFAWDLFESWYQSGAPSKESWAYTALGLLGGDATVRGLTPLIRQWPGESQHARAVTGLDILAAIGSDLSLMNLHAIAQKAKFKGLQQRAIEKIDAVAEARGLSTEELADRLVPDLDLDANGTLRLDFGPRQFTVGFDEQLRPFALDASGARLKDLPKPIKSDDGELAKAASERWKLLKKDAKAIASTQLQRLELAMCSSRSFPLEVFQRFLVEHPLMRHLARRLLWGLRGADGRVIGFRVAEDASFADHNDDAFELPGEASICLPHPLELDEAQRAGFGQIFADYEILQPFPQLGREVLAMNEDELAQSSSQRFKGKRIAVGSAWGLQHRGWRPADAQDGGWIGWFVKPLPGGLEAQIALDPGTVVGAIQYEPKQTLGELSLRSANSWNEDGLRPFSKLSAVARSELLRDLDRLAPLVD